MREIIEPRLATVKNLAEVETEMILIMAELRQGNDFLGYVAGMISSDGVRNIRKNSRRLRRFTDILKTQYDFPIFSAPEVFSDHVYSRLPEMRLPTPARKEAFTDFWRNILSTRDITDIFMTPRWQESEGAIDEHEVAQTIGLSIHYVEEELLETRLLKR